jgi:hypothetical protein
VEQGGGPGTELVDLSPCPAQRLRGKSISAAVPYFEPIALTPVSTMTTRGCGRLVTVANTVRACGEVKEITLALP